MCSGVWCRGVQELNFDLEVVRDRQFGAHPASLYWRAWSTASLCHCCFQRAGVHLNSGDTESGGCMALSALHHLPHIYKNYFYTLWVSSGSFEPFWSQDTHYEKMQPLPFKFFVQRAANLVLTRGHFADKFLPKACGVIMWNMQFQIEKVVSRSETRTYTIIGLRLADGLSFSHAFI